MGTSGSSTRRRWPCPRPRLSTPTSAPSDAHDGDHDEGPPHRLPSIPPQPPRHGDGEEEEMTSPHVIDSILFPSPPSSSSPSVGEVTSGAATTIHHYTSVHSSLSPPSPSPPS